MANVTLSSQLDPILDRRKQLRHQRRLKFLQATWRTFVTSALAGGLIWTAHLPEWVIRQPSQVSIKGNQLLSTQAIQALLSLSYPQNLIRLQPELIAEALESRAPIDKVTITRRLFPPSLTVAVQERNPVAVIPCLRNPYCTVTPDPSNSRSDVWLLDSHGIVMPLENYPSLQNAAKLPKLTVLGLGIIDTGNRGSEAGNKSSSQSSSTIQVPISQSKQISVIVDKQKQAQWPLLYQAISHSPVKVFEIDWRDATNLILKTELGTIHLGPYSSKLVEQLDALDRMRKLPEYLNSKQVGYIDLENPEHPVLQLKNTPKPDLAKKPVENPR